MVKTKKEHYIDFEDFDERCIALAKLIKCNNHITKIYGVPKGGNIPATRISYLTGKPLTFNPQSHNTAIIDEVLDSGATRHSFSNFLYFFPLVDKQYECITDWVTFWWRAEL